MHDQDSLKKSAAEAALELIQPGCLLGVGSGSTVKFFIEALADVKAQIDAVVSSSEVSTKLLEQAGFTVSNLNEVGTLDLYVDGADEATKHLHLIKGGGGALTREKILAEASRRFVGIIDESKLVGLLGKFPMPVEVIPMARSFVARQMVKSRGQPVWRQDFVTDNGNHIIDVYNLQIVNPPEMESRFNQIPGVVTVGIFANRPADTLYIASRASVRRMDR
ncbi:MAG: ribose-5-phosphate isomerase RpiA [Proteobacteria bacterium]|nr:ribose-5-phosphate isomerase RpiA [Pseudomonadota bacterium]MCH7894189.1 ribose-5-phosphate isomerase RpiA [Pseudomonadota bacterium]MCH8220364.1 ribose-5-phosphate isomerase RpiA [Pseudomonadota bacterium]